MGAELDALKAQVAETEQKLGIAAVYIQALKASLPVSDATDLAEMTVSLKAATDQLDAAVTG